MTDRGPSQEIGPNGKPVESVWDYPRPPRLERVPWRIRVVVGGATVVDAPEAMRVLETSQAPAYYVAPEHVDRSLLVASSHRTFCEWKGSASYADIVVAGPDGQTTTARGAAWTYRQPTGSFAPIVDHWAFYAQAVDECWVDDERVAPNEGDFYGGWITSNLTGPFKGAPGTRHW
ncbi:MAG: DUF427 domain-containing protein [Actinomycetota bacterium]